MVRICFDSHLQRRVLMRAFSSRNSCPSRIMELREDQRRHQENRDRRHHLSQMARIVRSVRKKFRNAGTHRLRVVLGGEHSGGASFIAVVAQDIRKLLKRLRTKAGLQAQPLQSRGGVRRALGPEFLVDKSVDQEFTEAWPTTLLVEQPSHDRPAEVQHRTVLECDLTPGESTSHREPIRDQSMPLTGFSPEAGMIDDQVGPDPRGDEIHLAVGFGRVSLKRPEHDVAIDAHVHRSQGNVVGIDQMTRDKV